MGFGAGVVSGTRVDKVIGIRPGDHAYTDHAGAVYHQQDENGNANVPHYEIQAKGDTIDFDLRRDIQKYDNPHVVLHTLWGTTDYTLKDRAEGDAIVDEGSGFNNEAWPVDITATSGKLRLTTFDPSGTGDGTEAAWYPYVEIHEAPI